MNYYEELFEKIDSLIESKDYFRAYYLVKEELEIVYIPKDYEARLQAYMDELRPYIEKNNEVSMDTIESYLKGDPEKQLIGVTLLSKKNLRDYLSIINEYLTDDGFENAKALLIDSLIRQELSEEIHYKNKGLEYSFVPRFLLVPEETDGFLEAKRQLEDFYMKEPSKLQLAMDLLFKEVLLALPINPEEEEGTLLFKKITEYIETAFNS